MKHMSTRSNNYTDDLACDLTLARQSLVEHLRIKAGNQEPVKLNIISQKSYPYSVICVVEAISSGSIVGRYYIKRLLLRAGGRAGAERQCIQEARLLRKLNDRMPSETVELALVMPEQLIMITAECAGMSFSRMLRWYSIRCFQKPYQQQLVDNSARCGDWLRRFHTVSKTEKEGFRGWTNFLCGEVDWRVKELSMHDPENKATYAAVADKLKRDLKRLPLSPGTSMIHRDFAPHNIFVDEDHIQVLDFSDVQDGHGLMDVINYIASLASRCEYRLVSAKLVHKMCVVFIQTYGGISDDDVDMFNLLLLLQSLKRLLVLYQSQGALLWDSIIKSGKAWHYEFLSAYINDAHDTKKLLEGPWPFMDLNQVQTGRR